MRGVVWLLTLGVAGCFSDPETKYNVFPKQSLINEDGGSLLGGKDSEEVDVSAVPACACTPAVGTWYRFNQLEVTQLSNAVDLVPQSLNLLWSKDIINLELNILFQLQGVKDGKMQLLAYSGARVAGATEADPSTVCYLERTRFETELPIAGCQYGPAREVGLEVYSGTLEQPKNCVPEGKANHSIPVSGVELAAIHTGVCDKSDEDYLQGQLTGVIAKTLLDVLCTCAKDSSGDCGPPDLSNPPDASGACAGCASTYSSLHSLLMLLNEGNDITYECETPDAKPGACLGANFRAAAQTTAPLPCAAQ